MWHWPFVWSEQVNGLSITPFECYSVERPRAAELTQTEALTCPRGRRPGFRVALHTLFAWFTDPLPKTVTTGRKSNRGPNYLHAGRDDRIQRSFFASTPLRFCAKAVAFLKVSPTPRTEPNRHKRSAEEKAFQDAAYAGNGQSSFFTCASSHFPPSCARNPAELFGPWQPRLPRLLEHEYTSMTRKGDAVALSAMPVVVGVGVFVFFYGVYSEDVGL